LNNLSQSLSGGLGVKVSLFNPFEHVHTPPAIHNDENFVENRHLLSVAAGLSIGRAVDFNLLPAPPGTFETIRLRKWLPLFALIILISALFISYGRLCASVGILQEELEKRKTEQVLLKESVDTLRILSEKRDNLRENLSTFPDFSIEQPPFSHILVSLTRIFPDSVVLDRIALEKGKTRQENSLNSSPSLNLKIEGSAIGMDYEGFSLLSTITEELEETPFFQNVMINSSEKTSDQTQDSIRFVLKGLLEPSCFR
jgi:Tfp pilus assembly protein PilN